MPTPAYTHFDPAKPAPTTQSVSSCFDADRNNFFALANALAMGALPDWAMTVTPGTGTYLQPQYIIYSNGVYRLRLTFTRNGSGQVTLILYQWSNDSGGSYATVKTQTLTYDAGTGAVASFTWS